MRHAQPTVTVGIVGIGFMGHMHHAAYGRMAAAGVPVRVGAIVTRDPIKAGGDWRAIRGNYGPPGGVVDLTGVRVYREAASLLADPAVDLVDICLPTDQHAEVAIAALNAGKHVVVEKPLALTVDDARAMVAASTRTGRRLMVGHVLAFYPEWAAVAQAAADGRYGPLLAGRVWRVISPPDWSAGIADVTKTGGPALDLHVHDTHWVTLLAGPPHSVTSHGCHRSSSPQGTGFEHLQTVYGYAPAKSNPAAGWAGVPLLSSTCGSLCQSGRPFTHGFEVHFERATITLEAGKPAELITVGGTRPLLADADGRLPVIDEQGLAPIADELTAAVGAVADPAGELHPALRADHAALAVALCHAEVASALAGGVPVVVDPMVG